MSREVGSLVHNLPDGIDIQRHREHKSKRGRRKNYWSTKIAQRKKEWKLHKFIRSEEREHGI